MGDSGWEEEAGSTARLGSWMLKRQKAARLQLYLVDVETCQKAIKNVAFSIKTGIEDHSREIVRKGETNHNRSVIMSLKLQSSVMEVLGVHHLSLVIAVLGLGRLVGCLLSSHLGAAVDRPRVASLAAYCVFQSLVLLFSLVSSPGPLLDDVAVFYAVAFAWGVTDALIHCHVMGERV